MTKYICNKTFQVLIASGFSIIALLALIIGNDFNLFSSDASSSVIQLRDLIGACIGFLLGNTSSDD